MMSYIYRPNSRDERDEEILSLCLSALDERLELYSILYSCDCNYGSNSLLLDKFVYDYSTSRSIVLGLYWHLYPEHRLSEGRDDTNESRWFWYIHESYLEGQYAESQYAFCPAEYHCKKFGIFDPDKEVPEVFCKSTPGKEINYDVIGYSWHNGLPPEVWENTELFTSLDDVATDPMPIDSREFERLVVTAYTAGKLPHKGRSKCDTDLWLGQQATPLFDSWRSLPDLIWKPLSVLSAMNHQAALKTR